MGDLSEKLVLRCQENRPRDTFKVAVSYFRKKKKRSPRRRTDLRWAGGGELCPKPLQP